MSIKALSGLISGHFPVQGVGLLQLLPSPGSLVPPSSLRNLSCLRRACEAPRQ